MRIVGKMRDSHQTDSEIAQSVTYEEMRLRSQATESEAARSLRRRPRRIRRYEMKAAACEEQLGRFEETRDKSLKAPKLTTSKDIIRIGASSQQSAPTDGTN